MPIKYLKAMVFLPLLSFSQNVTVSGYLKDAETGESLIGATVYSTKTKTSASANTYGFYSLSLPKGDSTGLVFTFVGYTVLNYCAAKRVAICEMQEQIFL